MRYFTFLPILLFVGINATVAQKSKPDSPYYKVTIHAKKSVYSLGEPIDISVVHYNGSDSTWHLYRPDSSYYFVLSYRHCLWRTQDMWLGHAFNENVFVNLDPHVPESGYGEPQFGGKITIKPKDSYTFQTDIMKGYPPTRILPGLLEIRVRDVYEAVRSDTIKICVLFTPESVGYMLKWIEAEKSDEFIIEWATNVLSDIYPRIKEYQFKSKDYVISYSRRQKKDNEKLLSAFRAFWEQNSETDTVKSCINKINTDLSKYYPLMDIRRAERQDGSCIVYPKKKQ